MGGDTTFVQGALMPLILDRPDAADCDGVELIFVVQPTMGSTQGVKANNKPNPMKTANTVNRLPWAIIANRRSCSDSDGAIDRGRSAAVALGKSTDISLTCGG